MPKSTLRPPHRIMALVAAGGQGARLRPLTDRRSKPAVPFGSGYRMDVTQMIDFHLERDADVTVAALRVPIERASSFGVLEVDADSRVCGFEEKPEHPLPMPGDPPTCLCLDGQLRVQRGLPGARTA
jgi:ADP-glucose pyrophosphorylase